MMIYNLYHCMKYMSLKPFLFNWILPQEHNIVTSYSGSMKNITFSNLIAAISSNSICEGVTSCKAESLLKHCIPILFILTSMTPLQQTEYLRPEKCLLLCDSRKCKICVKIKEQNMNINKNENQNLCYYQRKQMHHFH